MFFLLDTRDIFHHFFPHTYLRIPYFSAHNYYSEHTGICVFLQFLACYYTFFFLFQAHVFLIFLQIKFQFFYSF